MENNQKHILVVDDDNRIRDLLKEYLNENNYTVSTSENAEDAKTKILVYLTDFREDNDLPNPFELKTLSAKTIKCDNVIDIDGNRKDIKNYLKAIGVETKIHYELGIGEIGSFNGVKPLLAASTALSRRVLSLPIYPELTDLEVEYIIDQVLDCVA